MNTLASAPVAPLLARLFAEADAARPETAPAFAAIPPEERTRLMRSREDYRAFYAALKDYALPVSREAGKLLYMLAVACQARSIVEFGTSFGLSTIHLAAALKDNGGGTLITSEFEPGKIARARENLAAAGLADVVEFREGDALETLARDLPERIDLVLLDGAKSLYLDILKLLEPRLRAGAVIVADNADHCPDYLAYVESGTDYTSMAFTDDIELTVRAG